MAVSLRAVLFDLDGTLLDTAPDMVGALNTLRRQEHRTPIPYEEARSVVSHGAARLVKLGFPDLDAESFAVLQKRFLDIYRGALSVETRLFDGMDRVLEELARRGLLCGIVTNKPAWLTEPLIEQMGLSAQFACVVSGDSVSERKPHAMPLLHAARLAGVEADRCIYVGDAQRDIQAAHAAGMPALVATYGYIQPDEDWQAWGGDGFIREPLELLAWLDRGKRP
jgi:N-acetyl-D-muramate 6-phosphate phosphatase